MQEVDRELAFRYLGHFVKIHWPYIEPKQFVDGWHIGYICEHLQAVTAGEIKRLLINMPPRHMKSLGCAVFWPAWEWLQDPGTRWLFSSYAQTLSTRDSIKCRRVVQSPFFQFMLAEHQPDFKLVIDQNQKTRFENNQGGSRLATSVDGTNTGEGGDKIVVDDAHNVRKVESETERENVIEWWDQVMSSRLNDPETGSKVVNMQRSHEGDLSGHILKEDLEDEEQEEWEHLCLPARYEGENRIFTSIGIEDPRTEEGEPLWPDRFGDVHLKRLEEALGTYGTAGQLQQRPSPKGGGMFPVEKFNIVDSFDPDDVENAVRYWDKAGSEKKGSAFTAGVLILRMRKKWGGPRFLIADVVRGQWEYSKRERRIKQTAKADGMIVDVWVEQEPGSGGKESADRTVDMLSGFNAYAENPTGDKEARARPYAAQVQIGNVGLVAGSWNQKYISELEHFPKGKLKDQVDASSGGFAKVDPVVLEEAGVWGR